VGDDKTTFVDATAIATALLGDAIAANLFLLGFAFQRGLVPVSEEAITRAIELNGVQVRFNQQAFLWGRRAAHDEAAVRAIAGIGSALPAAEPTLDAQIAERERFLSAYQDAAWAGRYTRTVARVRAAETAQAGGLGELPLTRAVMRSLFKLMSYKDEYEVARLYTSGEFRRALEQQFEGEFTLKFHLAPPLFSEKDPVTGHLRKREYGPWMMRAFGLLARLRVLRGTRLDPFGYLAERRMERRLITDYESLLERLLPKLEGANSALISEIAALPLSIRGFGHVKERNLERTLARQEELLARLESPAEVVRIQAA
jgi:indolepyruvate ferredoxin oxidoreductase